MQLLYLGTYNNPISVALETPTIDANIYYTMDGNNPIACDTITSICALTPSATQYTGTIIIPAGTTTVKNNSKKENYHYSDINTFTYTVNATVATY